MKKDILKENTKKRWEKLAGIREAKTPYNFNARLKATHASAGGKGQTSGRTPEEIKAEQKEKIKSKLQNAVAGKLRLDDEQFELLLGMIHGGRSSHDLHKPEAPKVTSDEIVRRLPNIEFAITQAESDPTKQTKLMDLFNQISRLKQSEEERKKALEEPLTPEEENNLSDPSADLSLSGLSTDLRTIAGERDSPKQKPQDITTMRGPRGGFMNESKQPSLTLLEEMTKEEVRALVKSEMDKLLKKMVEEELEKVLGKADIKNKIGDISKDILKKLYKDLSLHHTYVIDRVKL